VLEKVELPETYKLGDGEEFRPVPPSLRVVVRVERIEGGVEPRQYREVDAGDLPADANIPRRARCPPLDVGDETPRQLDPAAPGCILLVFRSALESSVTERSRLRVSGYW